MAAVWSIAKEELPSEIELGGECRYHSVFVCPILRQQVSDSNPPMKLVCGYVISRDALTKVAQGPKPNRSSKCLLLSQLKAVQNCF